MNGTMSTQINLEQITEDILSGKATVIDATPYETKDYIRCVGKFMELYEGRIKVAYVRCPKCRGYINVYHDEIDSEGKTVLKKCLCRFRKKLILKGW